MTSKPVSTSASAFASLEWACPKQGLLEGVICEKCGRRDKELYRVDDVNDLSTLRSRRKVQIAGESTKAGLYGFLVASVVVVSFMLALGLPISTFTLVLLGFSRWFLQLLFNSVSFFFAHFRCARWIKNFENRNSVL
ncbi:MAG: hypothetical protein GY822_26485 [Deltaproteobacteria bacterium]|nr:hypothetical protein [Deltaproteobacteria bacterium]